MNLCIRNPSFRKLGSLKGHDGQFAFAQFFLDMVVSRKHKKRRGGVKKEGD